MGFLGWLQILLIAMKIMGFMAASWWLVLIPTYVVVFLIVILGIASMSR